MDNSELIEGFFTNSPGPEQVREFETRIASDPDFAEEVAFYLSVHTVAREISQSEKKQQFRHLYLKSQPAKTTTLSGSTQTTPIQSSKTPVRKLIYYIAAAAAVVGITFGIYNYMQPGSPRQMAANYKLKHLKTLSVTMGDHIDSLQIGINFYNENKADKALIVFEQLCLKNSTDSKAREYAGLAALRTGDYEKALIFFRKLETFKLYSNPALFYEAITLMTRNHPGDDDAAKQLLQQVVQKDEEGKETAREWLLDWKK